MTLPINYRRLRWLSLSDVVSGKVFCSTHSIEGSPWPWISEVVAEAYECNADDLECLEDEDGREFVILRGEPLVEIHHQRLTGNVAGLSETVIALTDRSVAA
ncbi:MAG TPA: hypothetical protein PLZ37_06535 [Nitrospira sp.]|nr:hypothetical protein [Nitrospira sp.]